MPVRIYDIAKKLGLENKEVLGKAKEMGIAAAKVPSSTLDKITAEYFEEELRKVYAERIAAIAAAAAPPPPPPEPAPPPPPPPELPPPVVAPPEPPPVVEAVELPPVAVETAIPTVAPQAAPPVEAPPVVVEIATPAPEVLKPPPPAPPSSEAPVLIVTSPLPEPQVEVVPPPPPPRVGDKIGFIQLPTRPAPRGEKAGVAKVPPGRPGARPEPARGRSDARGGGRGQPQQSRTAAPSMRDMPGKQDKKAAAPATPKFVAPATGEVISLKPPIAVRALAEKLNQKPFKIIADLMEIGVFANVNQTMDETTAQRVCAKYGYRFEAEKRERHLPAVVAVPKKLDLDIEDKAEDLKPRPPVVTIMGHVDHGKTTLLDAIRKSDVVAGEAGGITQHIGAYTISFPHPERKKELAQITFLDTPGHAAFSAMRARGANVTDIVVLVVAANDGVMPQTLEALSHARAAKVPIIVAVNKVDHPNANPMKARQQLQDRGLVPDDWGGDTIFADVSALTKQGVDKLIEMILLQADMLELKANPERNAKGNVIESGLAPGGPTATALVRKGTLRLGDVVLCGPFYGKVRALINEEGKRLKEAGPSVAVKLLGLNGVPEAGLEFTVVEDEKAARNLAEQRQMEAKALALEAKSKVTLENLFATLDAQQGKVLKVVVKADTQGSVEAIVDALRKIESGKVLLEVIHSAVGTITESDVSLASASNAVILGFHTRIDTGVGEVAKREGVQIKLYAIIYELIDQVKEAMAGMLDPIIREVVTGAAEVKQVFELSKGAPVAGCAVSSGRIVRGKIRVRRRKELIYEGVTQSLRRFQDEVNEVRAGMECGIRIEGYSEFQVGDVLECYAVEKVVQKL